MKRFKLGEAPKWLAHAKKWIWSDIKSNVIVVAEGNTDAIFADRCEHFPMDEMISNIIETSNRALLLTGERSVYIFDLCTASAYRWRSIPHADTMRANDGSVGPDGKLWFGTMEKKPTGQNGEIYSLDPTGKLQPQGAAIGIPNTFIWIDDSTLLVTDSWLQKTFLVKLTHEGVLDWSNKVVWLDLSDSDYTPDGGTVDLDGNIWIAIWGAAEVHKYSVSGILLDVISISALQPTSCAFGGDNMNHLLITTAAEGLTEKQLRDYPDSGKVLLKTLQICGKAPIVFKPDAQLC